MIYYSGIDSKLTKRLIKETPFEERRKLDQLILLYREVRGERIGWLQGLGYQWRRRQFAQEYKILLQEEEERIQRSWILRTLRRAKKAKRRLIELIFPSDALRRGD